MPGRKRGSVTVSLTSAASNAQAENPGVTHSLESWISYRSAPTTASQAKRGVSAGSAVTTLP